MCISARSNDRQRIGKLYWALSQQFKPPNSCAYRPLGSPSSSSQKFWQSAQLGDGLTRTSEGNPAFFWAVGEPAFCFGVGDGGRELHAVQPHISHGYLIYPSAVHRRSRICSC